MIPTITHPYFIRQWRSETKGCDMFPPLRTIYRHRECWICNLSSKKRQKGGEIFMPCPRIKPRIKTYFSSLIAVSETGWAHLQQCCSSERYALGCACIARDTFVHSPTGVLPLIHDDIITAVLFLFPIAFFIRHNREGPAQWGMVYVGHESFCRCSRRL